MNNKDTGGPAFPRPSPIHQAVHDANGRLIGVRLVGNDENSGLTIRDWFAGQALAGYRSPSDHNPEDVARRCFSIADAMLKERSE